MARTARAAGPLHRRVFEALRDEILSGDHTRDGILPSESALSARFRVSRITVRRALSELEQRGLVLRGQGRSTRVVGDIAPAPLTASVSSDLTNSYRIGRGTEVTVLGIERISAPEGIVSALRLEPGAKVVWINRLRSLAGRPVCHTSAHLPTAVADQLPLSALDRTPLLELLSDAGFAPARVDQTVSATSADAAMAAHLDLVVGGPLLAIDRLVWDTTGRPVELLHAVFRADSYRYQMVLLGDSAGAIPAADGLLPGVVTLGHGEGD